MNERRNLLKSTVLLPCLYLANKYGIENALSSPSSKLLVGICSIDNYISDTTQLEQFINFNHDILQYFSSFDTRVNPDMITPYFTNIPLSIWNSGRIPFLTWYPLTSNAYPTPVDICQRICNHEFDSYLLLCCKALLNFFSLAVEDPILGSPKIYLRFAHEMNINTSCYSNPDNFIAMWKYVFNFLRNNGITEEKLLFIFCPNCMDVGTAPFESFYPGDAYVNWNGLDGYNWGVTYWQNTYWQSFEDVFTSALERMVKLSANPISICEFGSTCKVSTGYDLAAKEQWLADAYSWLSTESNLTAYNIKMAIYYNVSRANDIDSGIFIPTASVIDFKTFDYSYQNYMTLKGLNTYYYNKLVGFKNNKILIDTTIFNGKF
jgi:mannan endo-1,4-beta-mannosidase